MRTAKHNTVMSARDQGEQIVGKIFRELVAPEGPGVRIQNLLSLSNVEERAIYGWDPYGAAELRLSRYTVIGLKRLHMSIKHEGWGYVRTD